MRLTLQLIFVSLLLAISSSYAQTFWVAEKIAGTPPLGAPSPAGYGFSGNGSIAKDSPIGLGKGLTIDNAGNLYFTEGSPFLNENRIIRIDLATNQYHLVTGSGVYGWLGDSLSVGPSNHVTFPGDIIWTPDNELFFAETATGAGIGQRIRHIDLTAGEMYDVAGNGLSPFETTGTGMLGYYDAADIKVFSPIGVAYHDNELYWMEHSCVRKLATDGTVQLIAGNELGGISPIPGDNFMTPPFVLDGEGALTVDENGDIFWGSTDNTIKKYHVSSGYLETIVGTGDAGFNGDHLGNDTEIQECFGLQFLDGVLYFCDRKNGMVRTWDPDTDSVHTIFGEFGYDLSGDYEYNGDLVHGDSVAMRPSDLEFGDDGVIYVYDDYNLVIREFFLCTQATINGLTDVTPTCPGQTFEMTVDGDLGDASSWDWVNGDCVSGDSLTSGETVTIEMSSEPTTLHVVSNGKGTCAILGTPACLGFEMSPICSITNNTITPNGDDLNDFFEIDLIGEYPSNNLYIYNRFGLEVNVIKDYDNVDKVFSGQSANLTELPGGSYYYIFEETDPASGSPIGDVANGWIHVLR